MKYNVRLATVLLFLASGARADEPKTYTIKFKEGGKGDAVLIKNTDTIKSRLKLVDSDGKTVQDEQHTLKTTDIFEETILEKPAKETYATHLKRKYTKARSTQNGEERKLPFEGKTVLIEKKDGKYQFRIDGKELTGEEAKELDEEFNKERPEKRANEIFAPKNPVKLNETWKVDPELLLKSLLKEGGMEIDKAKAVATGKLTKVYQKDGRQFGVMSFRIKLPIKSFAPEGKKVEKVAGQMTMVMTVDGCIDGSAEAWNLKGSMEAAVKGTISENGVQLNMILEESGEFEESWEPVTKK
jgi:hypothetical protein